MREHGDFDSKKWKSNNKKGPIKCKNGLATVVPGDAKQTFRCSNVSELDCGAYIGIEEPRLTCAQMDYYDFKSHADLGSFRGQGSNTWGWVSDNGREFAAVGQVRVYKHWCTSLSATGLINDYRKMVPPLSRF